MKFGMPKEKILASPPEKNQFFSSYDPLFNRSYVYDSENEYYKQYGQSYFASTMKKGGWDCLRHYEIMANYCIPYFRCLEACPATLMTKLPKKELSIIKNLIEYDNEAGFNGARYMYDLLIDKVMTTMREHLTTEAIAKSVLDTMSSL